MTHEDIPKQPLKLVVTARGKQLPLASFCFPGALVGWDHDKEKNTLTVLVDQGHPAPEVSDTYAGVVPKTHLVDDDALDQLYPPSEPIC